MSWKAAGIVKNIVGDLSASEKLTLLILADYHNDSTGQCNPSQKMLASQCLMSVRTLIRCTQGLENKGFIKIIRGHGLTHENNQYELICISQSANVSHSQSDTLRLTPQSDTSGVKAKVTSPRTKRVGTVIKRTVIKKYNRNKPPIIPLLRGIRRDAEEELTDWERYIRKVQRRGENAKF